jgi:hypothetical protein
MSLSSTEIMSYENSDRLRASGRIVGCYLDTPSATAVGHAVRLDMTASRTNTAAIDMLLPGATRAELDVVHDAFTRMLLTPQPARDLLSYQVGVRISQMLAPAVEVDGYTRSGPSSFVPSALSGNRWRDLQVQTDADTVELRQARSALRHASSAEQRAAAQLMVDAADIARDITAGVWHYFFFKAFTGPEVLATLEVE